MANVEIRNDSNIIQLDDYRETICLLGKDSTPAGTIFTAQGPTHTYAFGKPVDSSSYGLWIRDGLGNLLFDAVQHGKVARPVGVMNGSIQSMPVQTVVQSFPAGRTYAVWVHQRISAFRVRPGEIPIGGTINYVYFLDDQELSISFSGTTISITAERFDSSTPNGGGAIPYEGANKADWRAIVLDVTNF